MHTDKHASTNTQPFMPPLPLHTQAKIYCYLKKKNMGYEYVIKCKSFAEFLDIVIIQPNTFTTAKKEGCMFRAEGAGQILTVIFNIAVLTESSGILQRSQIIPSCFRFLSISFSIKYQTNPRTPFLYLRANENLLMSLELPTGSGDIL